MWCDVVVLEKMIGECVRPILIVISLSLSLSCDWTESATASGRDASVSPANLLHHLWRLSYFPISPRFLLSEKTSYHFKKYFQSSPSDDWSEGSDQSLLTGSKRSRSRVEHSSGLRFRSCWQQLSYAIKTQLKACKMPPAFSGSLWHNDSRPK